MNEARAAEQADRAPAWLVAALAALLFSLAFMQPAVPLLGFVAVPTDLLYLLVLALWLSALVAGRVRLAWNPGFLIVGAYFLALAISAVASQAPEQSAKKLLTQLYLLSLPVLVAGIAQSVQDIARCLRCWLAGTVVVAIVAVLSLLLFAVAPGHALLDYTSFHFGTLPPGDYPRLKLTFLNANMACNYLTVSLLILLAAWRLGWFSGTACRLMLAGIVLAAATTISPGLGGILLALGLWLWLEPHAFRYRRLALAFAIIGAMLFVVATAVTPIVHPTAPFLIHPPLLDAPLAPSGRLTIWLQAWNNFLADPLLGRGIGVDPVDVAYLSPSGELQRLTDTHNVYLSLAVQAGIVGLAALVGVLAYTWRIGFAAAGSAETTVLKRALASAFLIGLGYEGISGSFEDARHLWAAFGLLLAVDGLDRRAAA